MPLTEREVRRIRKEIDRRAEPMALFALIYLLMHPDPGKHHPDKKRRKNRR